MTTPKAPAHHPAVVIVPSPGAVCAEFVHRLRASGFSGDVVVVRDQFEALPHAEQGADLVIVLDAPSDDVAAMSELLTDTAPLTRVAAARTRLTLTATLGDLDAGAHAVIDASAAGLADEVASVLRYGDYVPPAFQAQVAVELARRAHVAELATQRIARLNDRERRVLQRLSTGAHQDEIGRSLELTPHEVRSCVDRIKAKLGATSQREAAEFARHVQTNEKRSTQ